MLPSEDLWSFVTVYLVEVRTMRLAHDAFVLAIGLLFAAGPPATSAVSPGAVDPGTGGTPVVAKDGAIGLLVAIRAAHHPGYDRLVFEFDGAVPANRSVDWTTRLYYDTGGPVERAHVAGNAFLRVGFNPAWGWNQVPPYGPSYGPKDRAYDLPNLVEVLEIGDWEGYLSFGIGVMRKTEVVRTMTLSHPGRFVVDIATDFQRTDVKDVFYDRQLSRWTSVSREVPSTNIARGALIRLFAGPTLAERADGLRLIASEATGFRDLRVGDNGVTRVTLRGGCDSHGSRRTIATEITRTLKALPGIDWVKIYDKHGHTAHPWGLSDSIPACLAP